ncbi:MAG: phosphoesterase PA-phosphatase, partial [Oscillospiraceae bacterium]|nr:phosphoesterase PA-phosphatase [Oscillospiraceae bacterium]
MERFLREHFRKGVIWLAVFIIFTLLIKVIDVKAIGPEDTKVGFAALNGFVFKLLGQHVFFEKLTKILGILALLAAAGFGVVGLLQFLKTKSLRDVDREIIVLGVFYIIVLLAYVFFELCIVNYRPVILD